MRFHFVLPDEKAPCFRHEYDNEKPKNKKPTRQSYLIALRRKPHRSAKESQAQSR